MNILSTNQEKHHYLDMCNLCRYAWFLQAQSHITTLPHLEVEDDEITDPTYCVSSALREKSRRQAQLLKHSQSRWKKKTSLREVHKATGINIQTVKVGDVVLTHNNTPKMQ